MPSDGPVPRLPDRRGAYLAIAGAMIVFGLPGALGALGWWFARKALGRTEWVIVAVTAAVGAALLGRQVSDYFAWLFGTIFSQPRPPFPWLVVLVYAMGFSAGLGLVSGTAVGTKVVARVRPGAGDTKVLPEISARKPVRIVQPAGGIIHTAAERHLNQDPDTARPGVVLGIDQHRRPVVLTLEELKTHALVFGSTGSGKSVLLSRLVAGLGDLGISGLVLDLKEDTGPGGMRDFCSTYAAAHAIPYQELCLSDPHSRTWFNPLAGMGPDEARDTILSLVEFEAPYWKSINEKALGQLCNLLFWAHECDRTAFEYPTIVRMGRLLERGGKDQGMKRALKRELVTVLERVPGVSEDDFSSILNPSPDEMQAAPGLGARLTAMYETQAGRTVLRGGPGREVLDVTRPGITYVGLDSQGKPELTKIISSAMLQRLAVFSSQRTTSRDEKPAQRFIVVDEANWVNREIIQNILSRARGAGISMVLATQGPLDWRDHRGDDFGKLAQNTNVAIIMSQGEYESAQRCADFIGYERRTELSHRVTGSEILDSGTARTVTGHIVTPDEIRSMGVGEAIVRVGRPEVRVCYVAVKPRDPRASV